MREEVNMNNIKEDWGEIKDIVKREYSLSGILDYNRAKPLVLPMCDLYEGHVLPTVSKL